MKTNLNISKFLYMIFYRDDIGPYKSGGSNKIHCFRKGDDGHWVRCNDEFVYDEKSGIITNKNKEPLGPDSVTNVFALVEDVVGIKRVYRTSKENEIKRRVTYVMQGPESMQKLRHVCLVEYRGGNLKEEEVGLSSEMPSGQATKSTRPNNRADPKIFREMQAEFDRNQKTKAIFEKFRNVKHPSEGLDNPKQVANARFRASMRERKEKGLPLKKGNFSNEIQEILKELRNCDVVQESILKGEEYPIVWLYYDWMIEDMKKHVSKNAKKPSVCCIDSTYNCGKCYVTIAVYQNRNLINSETGTNPICFGMAMLHFDLKETTYHKFCSLLKEKLGTNDLAMEFTGERLVESENYFSELKEMLDERDPHIGTDSDRALTNAAHKVFTGNN